MGRSRQSRLSESCDKRGKRRGREAARRGVKEWNKPQSRTRGRRDDCREMRGIENNSSDHSAVKRQKKPEDHTNTPKAMPEDETKSKQRRCLH
ncbi:uncharacterized protein ACWYII_006689 isoform 2-T2 [Salvelinus alpinus]